MEREGGVGEREEGEEEEEKGGEGEEEEGEAETQASGKDIGKVGEETSESKEGAAKDAATKHTKNDSKEEQQADDPPQANSEPEQPASRGNEAAKEKPNSPQDQSKAAKSTWSSYVPSLPSYGKRKVSTPPPRPPPTNLLNPRSSDLTNPTWASYFPSGAAFTGYLPDKRALSAFAASHQRDPEKSYAEQLFEFSKTPVGAATATGSGTASSLYAAYTAYTRLHPSSSSPANTMEFLSLPHTRASLHRLIPLPNDTLVSNLRNPILTLLEDTTPGASPGSLGPGSSSPATPGSHDTLMAACDPHWYRSRGVDKWYEHGSCAENLVMALGELNTRAGLKGRKCVGADVCVDNVPAPINLFMNAGVDAVGGVQVLGPKRYEGGGLGRRGVKGGFVVFRAQRDAVVVLSACPDEVSGVNGGRCMVAHFVVEEGGEGPTTNTPNANKPTRKPPPKLQRAATPPDPKPPSTPIAGQNRDTKASQQTPNDDAVAAASNDPNKHPASERAQTPQTDASSEPKARKKPKKLERRS
ncbi:hypothetical protein K490DRAFT_44094 [Saccharata proteae CBS 121410]|uniref:DUF1989 domain-containing protein n=1 Tax=Saccharata proteae CBS 121410 TaxID=1314787 RepID=A0A9P4HWC3_9PEZI|nr:hypothetical protein K490DRAFT_44094 [Saccharata proteae CBS 121410]